MCDEFTICLFPYIICKLRFKVHIEYSWNHLRCMYISFALGLIINKRQKNAWWNIGFRAIDDSFKFMVPFFLACHLMSLYNFLTNM